jgi:hypothetical protein
MSSHTRAMLEGRIVPTLLRMAKRSPSLAGADVGPHQRNHGCAEPEYQRNEQVFEPGAGTVARNGAAWFGAY